MNREDILEKIVEVMANSFELDPKDIVPEALLVDDLGFDSIDAIDFAVGVEEEIGIKVGGEELKGIRTVADAVNLIYEKVQQAEG